MEKRSILDGLCANHTRQLPCAAFERLSEQELRDRLKDKKKALEAAIGGQCRLELTGTSLIRAVAKLIHRGYDCYAKGDGEAFRRFVQDELDMTADVKMGRCDVGNRQDGPFRQAFLIVALLPEIVHYTRESLRREPNILRGSVFMRLNSLEFQADLFTRAIVYDVVIEPLIFITNSNAMNMDPLTFAAIYDQIWGVAELLKSGDALEIFDDLYRPFHLDGASGDLLESWLALRDKKEVRVYGKELNGGPAAAASGAAAGSVALGPSSGSDAARPRILIRQHIRNRLCELEGREDWIDFQPLLVRFLNLFGEGTQESLTRTCSEFMAEKDGVYSTSEAQSWMKTIAIHCLVHNNAGERPFAVVKHYKHRFKTMRTETAGGLASSNINNTFRPGPDAPKYKQRRQSTQEEEGRFWQADPALQDALFIQAMDGRKRRRETEDADVKAQQDWEAGRVAEETAKRQKLAMSKVLKQNTAHELKLLQSEQEVEDHLSGLKSDTSRVNDLKDQVNGRIGRGWEYSSLEKKFLNRKQVRLSPLKGKGVKVQLGHLVALLKAMIAVDLEECNYDKAVEQINASSLIRRQLPVLGTPSSEYQAYKDLSAHEGQAAVEQFLVDDPDLLDLEARYLNQKFVDTDTRQYLQVMSIVWLEKWDSFAAGCVELDDDNKIPHESLTAGGKIKEAALHYYGLTPEDQAELDKVIAQCF